MTGTDLSVVIPTRDRAHLLAGALASLAAQTADASRFEVVVIDDGSTDDTPRVCEDAARRVPLRWYRTPPEGTSAAKNLGVLVARGRIVHLFDDDDVAGPALVEEHLSAHRAHPDSAVAVLGRTSWAAGLEVTPLMRYVMDIGHHLFSYGWMVDGQELDHRFFWGGRVSCKRSLLLERGLFDVRVGLPSVEDVELGYRLAPAGLRVIYRKAAESFMARSLDFEGFCGRCERQGAGRFVFSRLHNDPVVHEYSGMDGADERWADAAPLIESRRQEILTLEAKVARAGSWSDDDSAVQDLWRLYAWAFEAHKDKGRIEAARVWRAAGGDLDAVAAHWGRQGSAALHEVVV